MQVIQTIEFAQRTMPSRLAAENERHKQKVTFQWQTRVLTGQTEFTNTVKMYTE